MPKLPDITLKSLQEMMQINGVTLLLAKELAPNDNAKNQLYLSGSMEVANILPIGEVRAEITDNGNKSLKAPLLFDWLQPSGGVAPAPGAQIILYPQYPEVRLSGFLRGSINSPNEILNNRGEGRLLFLGITGARRIIAWATGPESKLANEFRSLRNLERTGVFQIVPLSPADALISTRDQLLKEMRRIHLLGWINSKALNSDGSIRPCLTSHCVGYTLEAELGVPRNGRAEPDYRGWEVKAETVGNFGGLPTSKAITLMTPEPTGGFYKTEGVEAFVRKFGYPDKRGREDRINFGGTYRTNARHTGTKLTLRLEGFDATKGRITNPAGSIVLENDAGVCAAEWSFAAIMSLWIRKHSQAVYVPAQTRKIPKLQYSYGSILRLAVGTDIEKLLGALASGQVYYDPAVKLEMASTTSPRTKRRSQFRIGSRNLSTLYSKIEPVDIMA